MTPARLVHLRTRREALGYSQRELAPLVPLSRSGLQAVESGRRQEPATVAQVRRVLDMLEANQGIWA